MKQSHLFLAGMVLLALCACSRVTFNDEPGGEVSAVQVIGPADIFFEEPTTRGTEIINGSTLRFSWTTSDSLGIFPDKGNQVEFPITSTEGGTSAVFDGGGWGLKNGSSYAAYYPFSVWNYHRNNKKILLDYSGQVQNGNGSFAHLSAYDYLASSRKTPTNGQVTFQMNRQGAILYIDIVVPEPTTVNSLVISCDEEIFTEKVDLDISGEEAVATPKKMTNILTLEFKNTTTTTANETVRGYMAVYPVDFSNKTVYATLKTEAGLFGAAVQSREVNKGNAAFLRFSDSFTSQSGEFNGHEYIEMAPGFYWATCNVGAENPWDYGDYFCWGETEPRSFASNALNDYKWRNSSGAYTKYVTDESSGTVDNLTTLLSADDAATANWLGNWRMPTDAEWTTLRNPDNFTWEWTDNYNGTGLSGYTITSKVPRYIGNQIFLPAAGVGSGTFISQGSGGTYWSSSLNTGHSSTACNVDFWTNESTGAHYIRNVDARYYVKSVRPVYDPTPISSPEAVDLGLSVKWATFNVGATKPEGFGKYYAFGETKGYGEDDFSNLTNYAWNNYSSFTKTAFYTSTYKWNYGESIFAITKYSDTPEYGYKGFIDNKTVLEPQDDAASVNWGINWRTPTKAEWEELADDANCTWTLETVNGIVGFRVTSKKAGFTGSSIFLPFAGTYSQETYYENTGSYMTSNIKELPQNEYVACQQHTFKMYSENQGSGGTHFVNITFRECGYSVRPVYYEPEDGVLGVELNQSVLRLNVNENADLSASVFPENVQNKSLSWSSSDASVATVSASGRVTALKMGVATITVTTVDNNKTASCIVNVVEETGAIDLGLSVRWAPFNVGATTPEEYGDYYAWGETETYYQPGYAQSENPVWKSGKEAGYTMSSYTWSDGSSSYTRYSNSDGKTDFSEYDLVDDAARANWGGSWRTPTPEEWKQLKDQCDWTWTTLDGINGYLVTSKRNGNSIFLPAAGTRGGTSQYQFNSEGYYMQSSVKNNTGFRSTRIDLYGILARYQGFSVRPVTE